MHYHEQLHLRAKMMMRLPISLLLFGALISFVSAGAPTFCKCTCFKNSTLIQLGPSKGTNPALDSSTSSPRARTDDDDDDDNQKSLLARLFTITTTAPRTTDANEQQQPAPPSPREKRAASSSCTQCTRAFCLSQNLPICKDADSETDVAATCFQRDSRKDQLIVWGFILGTGGLLGWAAARRVIEAREGHRSAAAAGGGTVGGGGIGIGIGGGGGGGGDDRGAYVQVPVRGQGAGGGMR